VTFLFDMVTVVVESTEKRREVRGGGGVMKQQECIEDSLTRGGAMVHGLQTEQR
jgi:hypothetical protein